MLYSLLLSLSETYPGFFVFKFLTFRTGLAVGTSLIISFLIGGPLIDLSLTIKSLDKLEETAQ